MTTDKLLYSGLTYIIRSVIFKIYNELGFGHKENIYHRALHHELLKNQISFKDEPSLNVVYDTVKVGTYRPDFTVANKIIIELKAVPFLTKAAETQLIYYLKGTNYQLGLLINFGGSKLEIKRKIWTPTPIRDNPH